MPKVDEVGLKILFLLLPGIIAFFIVKSVGPKQSKSDFESGLYVFLYGVMSYLFAGVAVGLYTCASHLCMPNTEARSFLDYISSNSLSFVTLNPQNSLPADHIAYAAMMGIVLGLMIATLQTHSVVHRVLLWLKLTKRTGEFDMWGFTLNSPNIQNWATVRHTNGKVYQGWVRGYSDGGDDREIVLTEVKIYVPPEDAAQELIEVDSVPIVYLGLDKKAIIIEFMSKD